MGEYVHVLKWLFNKTQHLTLILGWSYTSLHENIHHSKCKCFNQLPEKLSGKSQIGMDADENNLTTVFALFYDFPMMFGRFFAAHSLTVPFLSSIRSQLACITTGEISHYPQQPLT